MIRAASTILILLLIVALAMPVCIPGSCCCRRASQSKPTCCAEKSAAPTCCCKQKEEKVERPQLVTTGCCNRGRCACKQTKVQCRLVNTTREQRVRTTPSLTEIVTPQSFTISNTSRSPSLIVMAGGERIHVLNCCWRA